MDKDPAILFVKPQAISVSDKRALQRAGVVVVEVNDVDDVKFVRAHAELSSSELLACAARAIHDIQDGDFGSNVKKAFANAVCAALANSK